MSYSIIIPVYNEEASLPALIEKIKVYPLEEGCEIILVNDGSTDGSSRILSDNSNIPNVKILSHTYNKGYGAAIKTGVRASFNDVVLLMDSDGQHNIDEIKKIINKMESADLVIGDRGQKNKALTIRNIGKWFLVNIAEILVGIDIPDINSGLRAFNKDKFFEFINLYPNGFSITTTMTLAFIKNGYDITYVPININKRTDGQSEVKFFQDGLKTLLLILRMIMTFNPLKIFMPFALIMFIVGGMYSLYHIIANISMPKMGIVFIISAINIFFFGLLADQLSMLRLESASQVNKDKNKESIQ
ncbi:glycosyltransferase family 2 protein [Candidatus Magnetominusculus xianensis]|uniref:Glycosyl transferase n=1 Tax=Candidatus Magnetominusculus xianensis TaxID=1748249 RepID=A0ABR5SI14_9BACT|nr:glycosyltransferase family 2 protein [Candidatus Magnetominusculus xianensis]KWT90139.1 glycosyl transferase [Candidatus Magnetominusculus xianensis]